MVENQKNGYNFKGKPVGPQLETAREHLARAYGMQEKDVRKVGSTDSRKHAQGNLLGMGNDSSMPIVTQGRRTDLTSTPVVSKFRTNELLGIEAGESREQIRRYIRLTELIPELLSLVDEGRIGIRPAVELSYLGPKQRDVFKMIEQEQCTPTYAQAKRMRSLFMEGKLTSEVIEIVMTEEKANQKERIILQGERFESLFPKGLLNYLASYLLFYRKGPQCGPFKISSFRIEDKSCSTSLASPLCARSSYKSSFVILLLEDN